MAVCSFDHIGLDHQVVVDEICRIDVVRLDAAHMGRRQVDLLRPFHGEELVHGGLVDEVEFGMGAVLVFGQPFGRVVDQDRGDEEQQLGEQERPAEGIRPPQRPVYQVRRHQIGGVG